MTSAYFTLKSKRITWCRKSEMKLEDLLQLFHDEDIDFVLLEGLHAMVSNRKDIFKIVTAKDEQTLEDTLKYTMVPIIAVIGLISKNMSTFSRSIALIDISKKGEKLVEMLTKLKNRENKVGLG